MSIARLPHIGRNGRKMFSINQFLERGIIISLCRGINNKNNQRKNRKDNANANYDFGELVHFYYVD
jgi:hypothetical protein